jgi:hypothetical protein
MRVKGFFMAASCLASRGSPAETTSSLYQLDLGRRPGLAEDRLLLAVEAQKYPTPSVLRLERQATSRRRRVP